MRDRCNGARGAIVKNAFFILVLADFMLRRGAVRIYERQWLNKFTLFNNNDSQAAPFIAKHGLKQQPGSGPFLKNAPMVAYSGEVAYPGGTVRVHLIWNGRDPRPFAMTLLDSGLHDAGPVGANSLTHDCPPSTDTKSTMSPPPRPASLPTPRSRPSDPTSWSPRGQRGVSVRRVLRWAMCISARNVSSTRGGSRKATAGRNMVSGTTDHPAWRRSRRRLV